VENIRITLFFSMDGEFRERQMAIRWPYKALILRHQYFSWLVGKAGPPPCHTPLNTLFHFASYLWSSFAHEKVLLGFFVRLHTFSYHAGSKVV
jgi:hypothetical protein